MYVIVQTKPHVRIVLVTSNHSAAEAALSVIRRASGFGYGYELFPITVEVFRRLIEQLAEA